MKKLFFVLVLLSTISAWGAEISILGRWVHRECYQLSSGDHVRDELVILKDGSFLTKNVYSDRDCKKLKSTKEGMAVADLVNGIVRIDGLEYDYVDSENAITLQGPFQGFRMVDELTSSEAPHYASQCPDFSGTYARIDKSGSNRTIVQKGCHHLIITEDDRNMTTDYWRGRDFIVADGLLWNTLVNIFFEGSYQAKFKADQLIRAIKVKYPSGKDYEERHFFTQTACKVPQDGKPYYVVERRLLGQTGIDHCLAFLKI